MKYGIYPHMKSKRTIVTGIVTREGGKMAPTDTRLRAWRQAAGLTETEVSDLTGISQPMLSKVERGLAELAPMTKVGMARALGVKVSDLFDPPQRTILAATG